MHRPNFFIIGAPKCGTTALARYLYEHPDVLFSHPKEPHFFSDDLPFGPADFTSESDYLDRCFGHGADRPYCAVGEASVWYLLSEEAVDRLLSFDPQARFIIMLRNPIDMAFSLHSQHVAFGWETERRFARAVLANLKQCAARLAPTRLPDHVVTTHVYREVCCLGRQTKRVLDRVCKDRVMLIMYDDFARHTASVHRTVLAFLGLRDDGRVHFPRLNGTRVIKRPWLARMLQSRAVVHGAIGLKRLTGIKSLGFGRPGTSITRQEHHAACEVFSDDMSLLAQLIGRDCSHWLDFGSREHRAS